MESISAQKSIDKALMEYDVVMEELHRPQEDLVMIAACELIKKSIADFLAAFLFENDAGTQPDEDILSLQQRSASINPAFDQLDFHSICRLNKDSSMVYTHTLKDSSLQKHIATLNATKELVTRLLSKGVR